MRRTVVGDSISCGVLNLHKPRGMTSREAVDRVVSLVRPAKAGHAGTLDPLATGVLVVCVGHATRLIGLAQEGQKRYVGRFRLGQTSDTDDITGTLADGGDWSQITADDIRALLPEFTGTIAQVPPQFSAVHVQGERAYARARRGEQMDLTPRAIEVASLELTAFEPPDFELTVECGSGTYIRSLGRDLGERLGCGAVMTDLRRTAVGPFCLNDAVPVDALNRESLAQSIQPAATLAAGLLQVRLTTEQVTAIRHGSQIPVEPASLERPATMTPDSREARVALFDPDGILIGLGETGKSHRWIQPRVVFPAAEG